MLHGCTLLTTVDNGRALLTTAVVWSNEKSNRRPYLYLNIFFIRKQNIWGGSECGNRISDANFLIVFHYGSILHRFRDMAMGRTTDDGWTGQQKQVNKKQEKITGIICALAFKE